MFKQPPKRTVHPMHRIMQEAPDMLDDYAKMLSPTDSKGRYLHYDQLRYRINKSLDINIAWSMVKIGRAAHLQNLLELGEPPLSSNYCLTPNVQRVISQTDRNTTSAVLKWLSHKIGESELLSYLLADLIEDEAISSSQLEGAATTTQVAKQLLNKSTKPRTIDEKMIVGNFKMMKFAWLNRHKTLDLDLILSLHKVGTEGIKDNEYTPGNLRATDDVVVVDSQGNTIHTPPPAQGLTERIAHLTEWINQDHDSTTAEQYIHPLIKAITLHFAIGYEHPFRDGNGRVARALFYWFMFKNDFIAFRYIAISSLLKAAPVKYGKSYLYSETDELDLTYFIEYQCHIVSRAILEFNETFNSTVAQIEQAEQTLQSSELFHKLNDKQKLIYKLALSGKVKDFTATGIKSILACSYNTAAAVLNSLVELQLLQKQKRGRETLYHLVL